MNEPVNTNVSDCNYASWAFKSIRNQLRVWFSTWFPRKHCSIFNALHWIASMGIIIEQFTIAIIIFANKLCRKCSETHSRAILFPCRIKCVFIRSPLKNAMIYSLLKTVHAMKVNAERIFQLFSKLLDEIKKTENIWMNNMSNICKMSVIIIIII